MSESISLSPELRKSLAARIQFYRDLGIHTFYRRGAAAQQEESLDERAQAFEPLAIIPPATSSIIGRLAELQVIREGIGECTRCRLSKGRKSIVFGVGN